MTQDAVSFSESFVAALLSWILISTRSIPSFDESVTNTSVGNRRGSTELY
jgi:hypothetical protein